MLTAGVAAGSSTDRRVGSVTMSIDPAGHAVVLGFRVSLRQLTLSLEQPDQFLVAIGRRTTM